MTTVNITDPLYSNQWHFDLLGDIETIWAEYSGAGVTVAVYDTGVDASHEDLNDNYNANLETGFIDGEPNSSEDGHGTSVAGLIAAENNGVGGIGVAWGATLVGVDYLNDTISPLAGAVIRYMSEYDIVNQSYGFIPEFNPDISLAEDSFAAYENATQFVAAAEGRDGLGTVMVKAVGNAANDSFLQGFGINGNAQGDSGNNVHYIVTVGALEEDGFVAGYSNYGANLLVSAGAASVTTDITGSGGYDSGNYTDSFGGTSAATPVVSGVIALMLEANPDLTVPEIQMILAVSASMTGSAFGQSGTGFEADQWTTIGDGTWNGGGLTYNPSYGYGAVDVFAAVRMAEVWSLFSDGRTLNDQVEVSYETNQTYFINDLTTTDIVFDVTEGVIIDHVYVTLDISHTWASDLEIRLITPDGDVFDLLVDDGGSATIDFAWTFGVAALRGIDSTGEWIIEIYDDEFGDFGQVHNAELTFIGAEESNQDVWHLTEDFLALAEVEGNRRLIGDDGGDGGLDGINMVSVTGDAVVNLGEGGTIRVDDVYWATQETDSILGVLTGDGDDRIIGRDADEAIASGRGDDLVFGGGGSDFLAGQQGDDVIFGDDHGGYGTEESAIIYRLFNSVFGREPNQDGHQNWMNQLLTGNMSVNEVAELFIASNEFQLTYGATTNTEFITLLFQNVLGRDPAESGLNAWVNNIENGMSRAEALRLISEGGENVINTRDLLANFEENSDVTIYAPRVYRLFEAIFGREPNEDGFQAWLNNFENGLTFQEAIVNFMGTPEFDVLYAGTDNEGFIQTLFTNVLGRPPADSGLAAWVQNLENGMPREQVVELFVDGAEFIIRTTDSLIEFMANLDASDVINAGAGNNIVAGGAYADSFVFTTEDVGHTTILDLEQWDTLVFDEDFGFAGVDEALDAFTQEGSDVVFSFGGVTVSIVDADLEDIFEDQISITSIEI